MSIDSYLAWLETCACKGCGKKRKDIARDANGVALELWVTEIECWDCYERRCHAATITMGCDQDVVWHGEGCPLHGLRSAGEKESCTCSARSEQP